MKKILLFMFVMAYAVGVYAQCNPYYNFKEGASWEITNYSAKDKVTGRQVNTIKSMEDLSNGWKAEMNMKSYDKKDELVIDKDIEASCENGVIKLDMDRFFPEETMQAFKDMDMTIETENLEIPSDLSVGMSLNDASLKLSGSIPFKMEVNITNRKVEAKESITTPAGTFDCYKITYTINTKSIMSMETSGVDWIAKDVGMVKSENYKKNGKLQGYSLLTKMD
ncbi:hypothetical protein [Fulvivirga lutimaris]|uniref:TapB family protein n=1 Tax=Fulvivirga lutimaris TaxID=1819566 RepID=UPI0012BB8619|nr:hypothetical protein [Fulvivirga lutimaris]MTI41844.1 hypothetical protein [Fulvivirga lutimaris]